MIALQDAGVSNSDPQLLGLPQIVDDSYGDAAYSPSIGSQAVSWQSSLAYSEMTMESEMLTPPQRRIRAIEDAIDYLFRLATAIRKPSLFSQKAKAQKIPLLDEDGLDNERQILRFALTLVEHRFPGAIPVLQHRLAQGIVTRRKRFLYRRRHQEKLSYRPGADVTKRQHRDEDEARTAKEYSKSSQIPDGISSLVHRRKPLAPPSQTSASAFSASKFQEPPIQTAQSQKTRTIAPSSDHVSSPEIPRPPKALPGSKEAECHYCCLMLPITELRPSEWRCVVSRSVESEFKNIILS